MSDLSEVPINHHCKTETQTQNIFATAQLNVTYNFYLIIFVEQAFSTIYCIIPFPECSEHESLNTLMAANRKAVISLPKPVNAHICSHIVDISIQAKIGRDRVFGSRQPSCKC